MYEVNHAPALPPVLMMPPDTTAINVDATSICHCSIFLFASLVPPIPRAVYDAIAVLFPRSYRQSKGWHLTQPILGTQPVFIIMFHISSCCITYTVGPKGDVDTTNVNDNNIVYLNVLVIHIIPLLVLRYH